mmetsp:Transcript_25483/g.82453  ORF Transcript_25483/g.82453 Transcript_25483/m.82453 type:complete len:252 (-) Transcript_25483:69-824(-)
MTSTLVSGGMWAIMQLQKSTLLEELQLTDAAQNSDAFIYRLSQEEGLEHFQFVVLVASRQDTYVPLHSAHIQIPRPAEVDNALDGGMYIDMARNLLAPILKSEKKQTTVIRLTLDQKFTARSVDTFIGRAAHVAMLETPSLVSRTCPLDVHNKISGTPLVVQPLQHPLLRATVAAYYYRGAMTRYGPVRESGHSAPSGNHHSPTRRPVFHEFHGVRQYVRYRSLRRRRQHRVKEPAPSGRQLSKGQKSGRK